MLKKCDWLLNIIMGAFVGVFIGRGIYAYWDFRAHPDLYVVRSAPWYTGILVDGVVTAAVVLVAVILKLVIRQRLKKQGR